MKKIIMLLTFIFVFAAFVSAQETTQTNPLWTTEVFPVCQGVCLEGSQALWQIQIQNAGEVPFKIQQLQLVDSEGFVFAVTNLQDQEAIVNQGETGTINMQGIVPPSTRGSTLYYKVAYLVNNNVVYDNNFRNMVVLPLTEVECTSNDFCGNGEVCSGFRCTPYSIFKDMNTSQIPKPVMKVSADSLQVVLLLVLIALLVFVMVSHNGHCKKKKK